MSTPEDGFKKFLNTFMSNDFGAAFDCFSKESRDFFLAYTYEVLKKRNPEAVEVSGIGLKEVQMMFRMNEKTLVHTFWKTFYFSSGTQELYQFGSYSLKAMQGDKAIVDCVLQYPNGQQGQVDICMVKEGTVWKYGFVESGMTLS
ncbi:MAG: hypothetical protein ACK5T0_05085 [Vampirovibrionales bacterium]|jgi:hypothetical protein